MSKLIVEMEMPKDCWCCPNGHPDWIFNDDGAVQMVCFCSICNTEEDDKWISETETERPSWCPIIGILPEQHGRLGDLDKLAKMVDCARIEAMQKGSDTNPYWLLGDKIAQVETIVPATERSET